MCVSWYPLLPAPAVLHSTPTVSSSWSLPAPSDTNSDEPGGGEQRRDTGRVSAVSRALLTAPALLDSSSAGSRLFGVPVLPRALGAPQRRASGLCARMLGCGRIYTTMRHHTDACCRSRNSASPQKGKGCLLANNVAPVVTAKRPQRRSRKDSTTASRPPSRTPLPVCVSSSELWAPTGCGGNGRAGHRRLRHLRLHQSVDGPPYGARGASDAGRCIFLHPLHPRVLATGAREAKQGDTRAGGTRAGSGRVRPPRELFVKRGPRTDTTDDDITPCLDLIRIQGQLDLL